jgi:hypothetical protein
MLYRLETKFVNATALVAFTRLGMFCPVVLVALLLLEIVSQIRRELLSLVIVLLIEN